MEQIFKRLKKTKIIPEEIETRYKTSETSNSNDNDNGPTTQTQQPGPSSSRSSDPYKMELGDHGKNNANDDNNDDGFDSARPSSPGSDISTPPSSPIHVIDVTFDPTRPRIKVEENQNPKILTIRQRILRLEDQGVQYDDAVLEICTSIIEIEKKTEQYDLALLQMATEHMKHDSIIQLFKNKLDEMDQRLIIVEENETTRPTGSSASAPANEKGYLCSKCNKRYVNKYYLPFHKCKPPQQESSSSTGEERRTRRSRK